MRTTLTFKTSYSSNPSLKKKKKSRQTLFFSGSLFILVFLAFPSSSSSSSGREKKKKMLRPASRRRAYGATNLFLASLMYIVHSCIQIAPQALYNGHSIVVPDCQVLDCLSTSTFDIFLPTTVCLIKARRLSHRRERKGLSRKLTSNLAV